MPGFTRRWGYWPGTEAIRAIEGAAIIDMPQPGSMEGVGVGVVAAIGEFVDMRYAVSVDSTGSVTTNVQPAEVFSAQDMIDKVGGFDETIGEFGVSGGNGYAALRGKKFSRLVVCPVNLCSAKGARFFRQLPLCAAQTNTLPVVPLQSASITAGREFRNGSGRLRAGTRATFTALQPIVTGTGGDTAVGVAAATQVFHGPGGFSWTTVARPDGTVGVHKGDILVIGYNNANVITPTAEAGTYRVAAEPTPGVNLSVERLDGANFAWTAQANVPFRVHFASDADTGPVLVPGAATPGGYASADAGGYVVPVRPLTDKDGAATDGTWTAGLVLTPVVVPPAFTGSTWDPLSGLSGTIHPSGMAFTAAVQKPNVASSATNDALYTTAIDALLTDTSPASEVNIVFAARTSATIRGALKAHELAKSAQGRGCVACIAPEANLVTLATVLSGSTGGVGAARDEGTFYSWPAYQTFVPEAVGFRLKVADGNTTIDGILDLPADALLASLLSVLPPERNPAQAAAPVPEVMAGVLGLQRNVPKLGIGEYVQLRAQGVVALRQDRTSGFGFQSGVTTSLTSGQKNINRRRFSYYCEDTMAERLVQFAKLPMGQQMQDGAVAETVAFCEELLSTKDPSKQRIQKYSVDDKSGNTETLKAAGIYVIVVKIQMVPTADFIVLQAEIGENVTVSSLPNT